MALPQILVSRETRAGRTFELCVQLLIALSVITFCIETLPDLDPTAQAVLAWVELVTVLIFTAEYVLRVAAARNKLGFIFSFYGLIDLAAILPFFLTPALDLRSLRVARMLRLFRILKLARYNTALVRLRDAFLRIREELVIYLCATAMLIFVASVGIYYFETEAQPEHFASVFHAMWWAVVTLTTVGYGDVYPVTLGGRMFTAFLLMTGVGVIAVPSGLFAASLTKDQDRSGDRPASDA